MSFELFEAGLHRSVREHFRRSADDAWLFVDDGKNGMASFNSLSIPTEPSKKKSAVRIPLKKKGLGRRSKSLKKVAAKLFSSREHSVYENPAQSLVQPSSAIETSKPDNARMFPGDSCFQTNSANLRCKSPDLIIPEIRYDAPSSGSISVGGD